jgi:hypothetical protein
MAPPVTDATFPALARATTRHVEWACDYLSVGDYASAIDALRDAQAAETEAWLEAGPVARTRRDECRRGPARP